jgi:hypothetical protein
MRRIEFLCSAFILLSLVVGGASRCSASDQERLIVRDGKQMICWVRFINTMSGDCGTQSYDAVFTAKISDVKQLQGRSGQNAAKAIGAILGSDLRLSVEPEEVFKGNPPHEMQLTARQGECFPEIRVGDDWLFFAEKDPKTGELEISYYSSNPSGRWNKGANMSSSFDGLRAGTDSAMWRAKSIIRPLTLPKGISPTLSRIIGC